MMAVEAFKAKAVEFAAQELFRKSSLSIRDGANVFESLLGEGLYKSVLEIGTYRGVTAAYISQFVERVTTIDLKQGKMERDGQLFNRVLMWEWMGAGNVSLITVADNAEKAHLVRDLDFDFAFVDGDHSYDGVAFDFQIVKRCGAVLFHDYEPGNDVARFVDTLPRDQVRVMDIFAFWQGPKS